MLGNVMEGREAALSLQCQRAHEKLDEFSWSAERWREKPARSSRASWSD